MSSLVGLDYILFYIIFEVLVLLKEFFYLFLLDHKKFDYYMFICFFLQWMIEESCEHIFLWKQRYKLLICQVNYDSKEVHKFMLLGVQ